MLENLEKRPSRIAFDFGIDPAMVRYYGLAQKERVPNLLIDLCYLNQMVEIASESIDEKWQPYSIPIHLYEILSYDCNAACYSKDGEVELAMFAGLRDVIYTFTKLTMTDPRLLKKVGDVSREKVRDYSIFSEPIGFQNITVQFEGKIKYYPNYCYDELWETVHPKEKIRQINAEVMRISSELFVWFHELYHIWRRHLDILKTKSYTTSTMSECNTGRFDDVTLLSMRSFEHDADRMALFCLIENIRQERGQYYNFVLAGGGIKNGYSVLFYGVFCTLTSLMVAQIISNTLNSSTHPNILARILYLVEIVNEIYGANEDIVKGINTAIDEWKAAYLLFGWKKFVDDNVIVEDFTNEQFNKYFLGVNKVLLPIDNYFKDIYSK